MNLVKNKNKERWLFVVNSVAGRGKTGKILGDLVLLLNKFNFDYEMEITKAPKHATELTCEYIKKGFRKIVAVGGDGTINEVINGIVKSGKEDKIRFGILPEGGGNDFSRNFHMTSNLEKDLKILLQDYTREIDVGKIEDTFFINALGLGFDAEVAENSNKIRYLNGLPRYILAIIKTLFKLKPRKINIELDDKKIELAVLLISVGNGLSTGGGFLLTPHALVDDGYFDICIIRSVSIFRLLKLLPTVLKGEHINYPEVQILHSKKINIKTDKPLPIYYDGELPKLKNPLDFTIEMLPRRIKLFCEQIPL
ncbi:MAG: hypothetical protein APR54_12695 [Candidatus Cloacimonas sp. SDB]|nr:MAG: hypothetical protein APR54_12695 [Candidatus Cloacimonas sp. SDB]